MREKTGKGRVVEGDGKTTERIRGTTPEIDQAALRLRREMTPAELRLWAALQGHRGWWPKFRRQHPVGRFVLDFYCVVAKLAVELDGGIHDHQVELDQARTEQLERFGIRVLRFRNEEVLTDLPSVLARIRSATQTSP